jgi:hypothetical protein
MKKHVKFLAPMSHYRTGDVASFDERMANKLIDIEPAVVEEVTLESTKLESTYSGQETNATKDLRKK